MKKIIVAAAVLGGVVASSSAFAAQDTMHKMPHKNVQANFKLVKYDTGIVKAVSEKADTVTLADGMTYKSPEKIELNQFRAGQKVRIGYNSKTHLIVSINKA